MRLAILVGLVLLNACIYHPRDVIISPEIHGIVLHSELPATDVNLSMSTSKQCAIQAITSTDPAGMFSIPAMTQRIDWIGFGDPVYEWTLCFETEQGWQRGLQGFEIGYVDSPIAIRCHLEYSTSDKDLCQYALP